MGSRSTKKIIPIGQQVLDGKGLNFFSTRRTGGGTNPLILVAGLAGKFFNGTNWRSTISTGNIGTLPLTSTNESSNVTGTTGLPSANHRYGVNLWTSIAYGDGLGDNYGFIAIGYFTPPTTGTYTFYTSSDDGSGVWIGALALPGATRTSANAVVNNGLGSGQGNTKRSGTISLTANVAYPIRIVHEEGAGGDNLTFSWSGPSITETTSLSTYFSTPATTSGQLSGNYLSSASSLVLDLDAGNSSSYPGSGTTWSDLSGYINNGTLTDGPTYSSADGGSIVFDGVNDTVKCSSTQLRNITNNFTTEIWYKTTGTRDKTHLLTTRSDVFDNLYAVGYNLGSAGGTTWKLTKYGITDIFLGTVPDDTNWHSVCVTFSSTSGVSLYLDGSYVANNANTSNLNVGSNIFIFGRGSESGTNHHTGNISNVKIYDRVLSATEITQNFNALRGRFGI